MNIAVLGSGAGGTAIAWDFANKGYQVSLFDFPSFSDNIRWIAEHGGIQSDGVLQGFEKIAYAGHDISRALEGARYIFFVGPAYSTKPFTEVCLEYLNADQVFVVCPGSTGGAFALKRTAKLAFASTEPVIAETSTLPYAVRLTKPGHIQVFHKLTAGNYIATLPAGREADLIPDLAPVFPLEAVRNVWQTSLQNGNPVIHPSVTLSNAARIEDLKGDFFFYEQGVTLASGRLMEGVDKERMAIGKALGVEIMPDPDLGVLQGYMKTNDYLAGYRTAPGFRGIKAQGSLDHRYLHEDVGYGLVFLSDLGKATGTDTPVIDAVITIASVMTGRDYRAESMRTLATFGLEQLGLDALRSCVE